MTNIPKKFSRIALTLYISNWIFGLGVIQYPLGTRRPTISFIYSSICIISYCVISAVAYPHMTKWSIGIATSMVPVKILFFSNIILTVSVITLAWYRSEVIFSSVKKSMMVNDMMEGIGIKMSIRKMRKSYMPQLIICAILVIVIISVNAILVALEEVPLHAKITSLISFCYPVVIMFIADMTFVITVSVTGRKYEILNKNLRNMLTDNCEVPQHKRLLINFVNKESKLPLDTISLTVNNPTTVIRLTKKIHLHLLKLCEEINETYGMQILLSIIVAFGVITGNIYVSYMLLQHGSVKRVLAYKSLVNSLVWTIYYTFKISNFTHACSRCKESAIQTGDFLNRFYDEPFANDEIQSEIRDFNIQLIQRPLRFTAAGYIALDTRLMQIMISSITTYLMIIIQLGKSLS